MAKYRVYLKEGKGIFDVEADCFDDPCGNPEYTTEYIEFSKNESTVACFERESIYAIINRDGAVRIDNYSGITIRADDIKINDSSFGKGCLPC